MDVNTRKNLSRHKSSFRDTCYCNLEKPIETEKVRRRKTFISTKKSMSLHCMKKFCRNTVMNVATLKDKVSGPDRETKSRQMMMT